MFSVFSQNDQLKRQRRTDSFSKEDEDRVDESLDNSMMEGREELQMDGGDMTRRNVKERQIKQRFYLSALEVLQLGKITEKDLDKSLNTEEEHEQLEEDKKLEKQELEFEKGLKEHHEHFKVQDMFMVAIKDEFEMLEMYTDKYPLLKARKIFLYIIKLISYICFRIVKHKIFEYVILSIILFNTVTLITATPQNSKDTVTTTPLQDAFDTFFLWAYTVEMSLKILALGFVMNKGSYLRDGWNDLDFVIVTSSLLPLLLGNNKSVNLSSLRSLRILRPLRTISSIRALKVILLTLFSAIPFLIDTFIVLFFYLLVFAIAGLQLFRGALKQRCINPENGINYFVYTDIEYLCGSYQDCVSSPSPSLSGYYGNGTFICAKMMKNPFHSQNYDTIFYSLLYMYQSCTLEGWTNTMYWTSYTISVYTLAFHLILVFIGANILINLTLAVIKAKFSDSESQSEKNLKLELNLDEMDADDLEQKRIQDEEEKKKLEEISSDSDEEVIPNLDVMKKYNREQRHKRKHFLKVTQDEKNLNAGQNKETNFFVYDEMMALKQKLQEESQVEAEQAKQQLLLDDYMDTQKKTMQKIFKKNAKRKAYNSKPVIKVNEHTLIRVNDNTPSIGTPRDHNFGSTNKKGFRRNKSRDDPDLPIMRKDKRFMSINVPKEDINVPKHITYHNESAKNIQPLPSYNSSRMIEVRASPQNKQSAMKSNRSEQRKSIRKDSQNYKETSHHQEDFDIILQDLDDLNPLEEIMAPTKASNNDPTKKRMMLRSTRVKFDSQSNTRANLQSYVNEEAVAQQPKHDYSDIISNFDEVEDVREVKDIQFRPMMNSQNRVKLNVPSEDSDSDDLFNDPDFLQEDQIKNKDHALAQAIFQKRYNSRPVKKKNQTSMDQRLKKGDPKIRGFIIHGLQEHLKQLALKKQGVIKEILDDGQMKQMQDLVLHTNDDNGDYNNLEDDAATSIMKKKKDKKLGASRDYKLILTAIHDYHSSSKNDIMEAKLHLREKERMDRLEKQIKNKHYTFQYQLYDEVKLGRKEIHKLKKEKKIMFESHMGMGDESLHNQIFKRSRNGSDHEQSQQFNLRGSTLGVTDFAKMKRVQTVQIASGEQQIIVDSNVRIPVSSSGMVRRILFLKMQKLNHFEDIDLLLQFDKSMIKEKSDFKSSVHRLGAKKKKGYHNPKEEINQLNFVAIKKAIHETIDDQVFPYELPGDRLYLQILQLDFSANIKSALHWSGDEIFTVPIQRKRANKIRQKLDSSNQNSMIYLAGIQGFIKVRHSELQDFVLGKFVSNFLLTVVVGNTIILSLNGAFTDNQSLYLIEVCNTVFTWIFIVELGVKIISFGPLGYVRDTMNVFDGTIVMLSVLEMTLLSGASGKAVSAFRAIRIFRVLRITRLLRTMQFMGVIIKVVATTLENFIYICGLMFLFIIIYSLLGMQLFGGSTLIYRNNNERADFHSFLYAFLAMFQLLTIENWDDLIQLTIQSTANKFLSMIYLISFLIIGNYVFLNLFLAILMDGFSNALDDSAIDETRIVNEDEFFMQIIGDALLESHADLEKQKKQVEYLIDCEKKKGTMDFNPGTQNISLQNSVIDDELEIDLVNHTAKIHKPLYDGIACDDSIFIFNKKNFFRIFCYKMVMHHNFETLIQGFIMVSSLKLAIDTYIDPNSPTGDVSAKIDIVINLAFTCECAMKIIAFGFTLDENSYLTESWSQLDFFIVFVSLVDMSFSSVNIPAIKILRLLRILRPLRFISHNVNLKTIVIALFESLGGIANVLIVVLLIWLMFAILGISLLGGRFGSCTVNGNTNNPNYGISQAQCAAQSNGTEFGNTWVNFRPNMDNAYNAMIMVYCLTTLEGWPNILYPAMDSDNANAGPSRDNYAMVSFYFVTFIMVSSFVLINLFTGVICYYFEQASKNEKRRGNIFLTQEQENWIEIQTMTIGVQVGGIVKKRPKNIITGRLFDLVEHGKFDAIIMVCIVLNILVMAMDYEGMTLKYSAILENINLAFTVVFFCECTFKMTAYGVGDYLQSGWNRFDLFVVTSSALDIILTVFVGNAISFLRVGPQLIRIIRVLRVTRLLKLIKSMKSLQKLLQTLLYSLPALVNIGALTLLVFYIFAILAVFLFKEAPLGDNLNQLNNFANFGISIISLYRSSTGENWEWVMFDVSAVSAFAPIYFMIFLLVSTWVMLNLFTLIIIQYFENYNIKEDNPLDVFQENLEVFRSTWLNFTVHTNGEKLHQKHIIGFFQAMPHPLGFGKTINKSFKQASLAKEIMSMQLIGDGLGHVYFNELLYAAIKRAAGKKIFGKAQKDLNLELQIYLNNAEQETRKVIEINKNKELKRKKAKYLPSRKNPINPLVTYLFNRMVFLTWRNYAQLKQLHGDTPRIQYYGEIPGQLYRDNTSEMDSGENQEEYDGYVENVDEEPILRSAENYGDGRIDEQEEEYSPAPKRPYKMDLKLTDEDFQHKRLSQFSSPLNSDGFPIAQSKEVEPIHNYSQRSNKNMEAKMLSIISNQNVAETARGQRE